MLDIRLWWGWSPQQKPWNIFNKDILVSALNQPQPAIYSLAQLFVKDALSPAPSLRGGGVTGGARGMEQETVIPHPGTGSSAAENWAVPLQETQTSLNGQWPKWPSEMAGSPCPSLYVLTACCQLLFCFHCVTTGNCSENTHTLGWLETRFYMIIALWHSRNYLDHCFREKSNFCLIFKNLLIISDIKPTFHSEKDLWG